MVIALSLCGCGRVVIPPRVDIAVAGAQIPVELVENWLHTSKPGKIRVERVGQITFSQSGFEALLEGRCDLACTDRRPDKRELDAFGTQEIDFRRVAFYGFALYVHPDNPLDNIWARHLKLLFRSRIADWKELGGADGPIRLIGPRKGTRGGEILMRQAGIFMAEPTWETLDTDAEIVRAVADDPSALGFAAIGLDTDVRYLGLRMERGSRPALPSLEEIESERYGLAKVIYVYFRAPPSADVQAALDYLDSAAGRAAIEATDVWPFPAGRSHSTSTP